MPPRAPRIPSCRLHRPSGQAVVRLNDKDFYLGRHESEQSKQTYKRVIEEWLANPRQVADGHPGQSRGELTINELFLAYWDFASSYYIKNNTPTSGLATIRDAARPITDLYGTTGVGDFGCRWTRTVGIR